MSKNNIKTLKQAKSIARKLRATGKTVKIFRHSRLYCQPFVGLASAVHYEVK